MDLPETDAYGRAVLDHYEGGDAYEIVERDDGWVGPGGGPSAYFAPYPEWPDRQREAMDRVEGRVLDVGCGAGRHLAYLDRRGHDAVGIDASPGAVEVCRRRGLDAHEVAVEDVTTLADGDPFETLLMLGNNFGLVGTRERAPAVLGDLAAVAADGAVLLAESRDPTATDDAAHLAYHERNRERDRLPGALRIRVRYRTHATPWFDYLLASPDEMADLVDGTPWRLAETVDGPGGDYVGVLRLDG